MKQSAPQADLEAPAENRKNRSHCLLGKLGGDSSGTFFNTGR